MQEVVAQKEERLDVYLSSELNITRSKVTKMIKDGKVLVNGNTVKAGTILKLGDIIAYEFVIEKMKADAEEIPLNIVYEDDDVIVVNKQNGMVVHPAVGNKSGTLVNAIMNHSKNLSHVNGEFRPGIVHRIDAYTTGLLMIAKNDEAHNFLAEQLKNKTITRRYIALCHGVIDVDTGLIDAPIMRDKQNRKKMAVGNINAKSAITHFKVLKRFKNATLVELKLETGRTHQIRVHMSYIGHPVVNDPVYGGKKLIDDTGQCLHAKVIGFIHPKTREYMEFTSELPECFNNILKKFESE